MKTSIPSYDESGTNAFFLLTNELSLNFFSHTYIYILGIVYDEREIFDNLHRSFCDAL